MNAPARKAPARAVFEVQPTAHQVREAGATLSRILAENSVPPDAGFRAELAAIELLTNIVRHGAANAPIQVSLRRRGHAISIAIADDCAPFDMSARPAALPQDPLAESGRGLWIVRHAADRFRYRCCGSRNFHFLGFALGAPAATTARDQRRRDAPPV